MKTRPSSKLKQSYCTTKQRTKERGGVAQWVAHVTRDRRIPVSREFEQETLLSLLSTGWFLERIRA